MIIQHILEDDWTGELYTVREDDATSPTNGYTQKYAEQAGADYAKHRAPEQLSGDSYTCISSVYVRH